MNTPTKAVEANSSVQNADKTSEGNKAADHKETKGENPERKVEVTNPAPTSVK